MSINVADLWWEDDALVIKTTDGRIIRFNNAYFNKYETDYGQDESGNIKDKDGNIIMTITDIKYKEI